jgi:hypothetical protein
MKGQFMSIDDQTAMRLRREIYADGAAKKTELLRLVAMERVAGGEASRAFVDLLGDVACDVMLNAVDPPKYIQPGDAEWLVSVLSRGGGLANWTEYAALVRVIRDALFVPSSLAAFALAQIERAILAGAAGHAAGVASDADIEALRSVVYATTEDGALHVTRQSAEALFRIADALAGVSDPAFEEFFAKAIGNYLMGVALRGTPSAAQRRHVERWLDEPAPTLGDFVASMFDFDRLAADAGAPALEGAAPAAETARAEKIDAREAEWLIARLNRDGRISPAEKRLLRFLKAESPSIAPALAALIDKAAA